jgi:DNA polymerase
MTTKSRPLLDADYSAIEARITCWLAGQEDALEEYRQGVDRYKRMASVIYGIPEEQVNKHPQRFIGKQAVLGCGFGMGPAKFRGTCENFGYKDLPARLEEKAVASFRAKHPKIKSYWKLIENAAKRAIVEKGTVITVRNVKLLCRDREGMPFLHMQLPSGRQLSYPRPRIRPSRKFEGATEIVFFGHIKGVMWGDVPTWGGTLVENAVQAVAADIMANGTRNAERAGYETATLIHDQCLSYYHPERGQTVEEFVRLLTTLPKWGDGLPLEAEGSLVPFYRKD